MRRRVLVKASAVSILLYSGASWAQQEGGSTVELGAGTEADAGTAAAADSTAVGSDDAVPYAEVGAREAGSAPSPAPAAQPPRARQLSYMERYKPDDGTWQVGVAVAGMFPSKGLQLIGGGYTPNEFGSAAWEFAGRVAYYPKAFLGIEGEVGAAEGTVAGEGTLISAWRGHVVGQLPFWSIVPFALAGIGGLGGGSGPNGHDIDFAFHFGGGVKLPIIRDVAMRLDVRETMSKRTNSSWGGISFTEEVMVGFEFTIGRPPEAPEAPPIPPDADSDHVPDYRDSCPDLAGLSENGCPPDSDHDGIPDPNDHCPYEPGADEQGCPDRDPDSDGVPLPCDLCPNERGQAPDGCPIRDADGDGVLDDVDQCKDQPETKNGFDDQDGCPDEVPEEVKKFTGAIKGIQFVQGSATIRPTSERELRAAADVLKKFPSVQLEVSGHTSSEGDAAFNQKLSEQRAQAVVDWLVAAGVEQERLTARGAGATEPAFDNATPLGRTENRRIEFKIATQ